MPKEVYKKARGNEVEDLKEDIEPFETTPLWQTILYIIMILILMVVVGYFAIWFIGSF